MKGFILCTFVGWKAIFLKNIVTLFQFMLYFALFFCRISMFHIKIVSRFFCLLQNNIKKHQINWKFRIKLSYLAILVSKSSPWETTKFFEIEELIIEKRLPKSNLIKQFHFCYYLLINPEILNQWIPSCRTAFEVSFAS